jgi:HD-like signal output (HDOD) protein
MSGQNVSIKAAIEQRASALTQRLPILDGTLDRLLTQEATAAGKSELLALLQSDPGLCVQFLALANSSCFGGEQSKPVATLEQAWARIGIGPLRMLAGTALLAEGIREEFAAHRLWKEYVLHSQTISAGCKALARVTGLPDEQTDMYAVAGLTHDIGRVVMMAAANPEHATLLGTTPDQMLQIVHQEQEAFGLNHCHIGWELFRKWRFPNVMQEGILRHHSPLVHSDFCYSGAIVFISHFVTMSDFTGAILAKMLGPRLLERLQVTDKDLAEARRLAGAALGGMS